MADDPSQSVADPNVTDPNIIPAAESASVSGDRPVSTILADSPTEPKTPLADPATDYTVPVPAESAVATESATIASSPVSVLADLPTSTPILPQSPLSPISPPVEPTIPSVPSEPPVPSSPPEAPSGGSIQDSLPPDQPSKVQPEVPVNAPSPVASQAQEIPFQSAEIKSEPLEGTQEAPLADSDSQKTSFGDILEGTGDAPVSVTPVPVPIQPPSSPVSEPISSTPKTSFGDLVGIPPTEEPTINIEPIESRKPVEPLQSPISPPSPLSPLPAEAPAKESVSPSSPQYPQPPTETIVEAKADFSVKRQQALQTRRKKREDHLAKIIALVSQKGKVFNRDVRDVLRVSQSTATNYLHSLVKDGKIKKEGKAKATIYSL